MNIDANAKYLIDIIEEAGYEAYIVGGCVRDYAMGRECSDIDITTSAKPLELEKILDNNSVRYIETGLKHGTITAIINSVPYEITTFRIDGDYKDSRHPENVSFVTDVKEDLARRDFTINAIAYNDKRGFVDELGGILDIENKIIRAVGDPNARFTEDALRIMRAIRFSSVLGFAIEENTKRAIFANMELLSNVSVERVFTELSKLLMGDNVFEVLVEYRDVIAVIIPELKESFDCQQITKWHIYDVWKHTCKTIEQAPKDLSIRITMLLHDIGKPRAKTTDLNGNNHFFGHQRISADMAAPILKRLKVPNTIYDRAMAIIPIHDVHIGVSRKNVKRWLSRIGEDALRDLLMVKIADKLGQNPAMIGEELQNVHVSMGILDSIIVDNEPFRIKDLAINGNDLMALGYSGREVGKALEMILHYVIEGEIANDRAELIKRLELGEFDDLD